MSVKFKMYFSIMRKMLLYAQKCDCVMLVVSKHQITIGSEVAAHVNLHINQTNLQSFK